MNTPTHDVSLDSLRKKISQASKSLESIPVFQDDPNSQDKIIPPEVYVWDRLEKLGIYKDEDSHELLLSSDCPEGEARRVFCENGEPNLPPARFKRMWSILTDGRAQPKENSPTELEDLIRGTKPLGQWSDQEVLNRYGIDSSDDIIDELGRRSKGRPFVAFVDESKSIINYDVSLMLLREARRRTIPVHHEAKSILYKLYRAGHFPAVSFHECPLHPSELLLDGYCDKCCHNWEAVDDLTRKFVRVIGNMNLAPKDPMMVRQFVQVAMQGIEELQKDYPKPYIEFERLKDDGELPVLRKRSVDSGSKGQKNKKNYGGPLGTNVNMND